MENVAIANPHSPHAVLGRVRLCTGKIEVYNKSYFHATMPIKSKLSGIV